MNFSLSVLDFIVLGLSPEEWLLHLLVSGLTGWDHRKDEDRRRILRAAYAILRANKNWRAAIKILWWVRRKKLENALSAVQRLDLVMALNQCRISPALAVKGVQALCG